MEGLAAMAGAARHGDQGAGEQARQICEALAQADDEALSALGRGLLQVLEGAAPGEALAGLPEELRERVLEQLEID